MREQFIEFNEILLFEDLNMFNQKLAEYRVLYNSKRPHKSLELLTPVEYILHENKNCNMWWPYTILKNDYEVSIVKIGPASPRAKFGPQNNCYEPVFYGTRILGSHILY